MKSVTSISGGQTSAYLAAKYPTEFNVFSLVRINDPKAAPKDKKFLKYIQDKLDVEVIATAEDDIILQTIYELEQFIGSNIDVVAGETFDDVCEKRGGWLPNKLHRYCTTEMKLRPLFRWWRANFDDPVSFQIGFRANEQRRAKRMSERLNTNGLLEFKDIVGKLPDGRNKWKTIEWQKPTFPLIENKIFKDEITEFWKNKPVKFAPLNNCVGCFHRNPLLLRKMFDHHPSKMEWFASQERIKGNGIMWQHPQSYDQIKKHNLQNEIDFDEWESDCDSGHCGL